tara:strand:- start:1687 stop:2088 length:402 start_codon:yes stop_codon:yes gene_type:complete
MGMGKNIISERTDWMHGHDCLPRNGAASPWHDRAGGIVGLRLENDDNKSENVWLSVPDGAPNMYREQKTRHKSVWDSSGGLRCLDGYEMFVQEEDDLGFFIYAHNWHTSPGKMSRQVAYAYICLKWIQIVDNN